MKRFNAKSKPVKRPWIKKGNGKATNSSTRFDNEDVPMFESKLDVERSGGAVVRMSFSGEAAKTHERIFGTDEEIRARRLAAIAEQKKTAAAASSLPNVIGDSHYEGYDPALRTYIRSKAHLREVLARKGERAGVGKLRNVYSFG